MAGDAGAIDRTGRHRPALNEHAAITGPGRWDGHAAIALDGYGDYVSVPASPDLDLGGGAFTIEWMGRLKSLARTRCLVAHWTFLQWEASAFSLRVENGVPALYVPSASGQTLVRAAASAPVEAGMPLHVAATGDGAGGVRLWVNGAPAGAAALPEPLNACPSPLTIGVEAETEFYLEGEVHAVRITRGAARGIGPRSDPFPGG